jgi:hypothetical protein
MAKPSDRVLFAITAVAGALILIGCLLPAFELYLEASIGAGDDQRVFRFDRELTFATYHEPGALVFPFAGIVLLATGLAGVRWPRVPLILTAVAVTIPAFVQTVRTVDIQTGPEDVGVTLCDESRLEHCVYYLAPAIRDFRADILREPIARRPEFDGPSRGDYNVRLLTGWLLVGWTVAIYSLFAWFRPLLFLKLRPWQTVAVYALLLVVVFVIVLRWWLRDFEP